VLHRLLVLGEATKRLSAEFRAQHANVPWRQAAGLRDVLVHDYDNVNLERVWTTATEDIPLLLDLIEPLLPSEEPTA